jgi:hypothetical protein
MTNQQINLALAKLIKRAESSDPATLVKTFVDSGMLTTLMSSVDHQVIYGRRGTGKTHALRYLSEDRRSKGDLCVYIDLRTIGSSVGIYGDPSIPLPERATRLLRDTLTAVHEKLFEIAVGDGHSLNLSIVGEQLDHFLDAALETVVVGPVSEELGATHNRRSEDGVSVSLGHSGGQANLSISANNKLESAASTNEKTLRTGMQTHRVRFGAITQTLTAICRSIAPRRIWVLLDEWSSIPLDLQPYVADLMRRCMMPVQGVSLKVAAIEQRSNFSVRRSTSDYVGVELGADIAADLNLDDFMVFDNDQARSTSFFRTLLYNHFRQALAESDSATLTESEFARAAFTQRNVLDEIVRAAEGVPRDAINIIATCAQKAMEKSIEMTHVRTAAKLWYERDKERAVNANPEAESLLSWIRDEVIGQRKARAFLLRSNTRDALIEELFDSRVLHVLKRNVSSHDEPGVRYDVYKIDYGCYVDLLSTARQPTGFLYEDDAEAVAQSVEVPQDDYRAIRRAILNLAEFRRLQPHQ